MVFPKNVYLSLFVERIAHVFACIAVYVYLVLNEKKTEQIQTLCTINYISFYSTLSIYYSAIRLSKKDFYFIILI